MFSSRNGDRFNVPNVILLITAATSDVNTDKVTEEAEEAKKGQGIHILAVGVGITDTRQLRKIVSWPLQENLYITRTVHGVGEPLYKIAFALLTLGQLPPLVDAGRDALTNVALSKPVKMSSFYPSYGFPENVVDGLKNSDLWKRVCVHSILSDKNSYQWLRVDLLRLFEVYGVNITNRGDCCGNRLRDFDIFVTMTPTNPSGIASNSNELCLHHAEPVATGATVYLNCSQPVRGRYVTLSMHTNSRPLHICEMEVLGIPVLALTNVALKKPAAMSTYRKNYNQAENIVDGLKGTDISQCARTSTLDSNPYRWWRVDLLGLFEIYSVIITNRGDCCGDRLRNFYIFVTLTSTKPPDDPDNSSDLCMHHPWGIAQGASKPFACMVPIKGRYLTLVMYTNIIPLSLCEVEVLGMPLLENWTLTKYIYPPAVLNVDGLGLSRTREFTEREEVCPDTHFQCARGFCIPTYLLNNGVTDCPLGEDENIADLTCPGFFRCWITGNCLHPDYLCDGVNHCPFNEDERYCEEEHCPDQCVCEGQAFQCQREFSFQTHFQLRYLDLTGSNNPDLKGIEVLSYLQYLNLSSCKMVEVTLSSLNQLRILDLSYNYIKSFDFLKFSDLSELLHLNLSFNPLSNLLDPAFSNFVHRTGFIKLQSLSMVDIGLDIITTKGLTGSLQIYVLDIRQNPVDTVHTEVFGKSLRVLYTDNPKLCCHHFHLTQLAECHAPVDELSSCNDLLKSDFLRVLLWVLSTMALAGNLGVWIYRAFIEKQGSSMAYKVMVINLSAADFLMGVYMAIIGVADLIFRGIYVLKEEQWRNSLLCKIAGFLAMLSSEMSAFVICLITLDRLILLRFPFSLHFRLSKLSASVGCCIAWVIAVILAALPFFVSQWQYYSQNSICLPLPITRQQFPGQQYAFGVFIILNFILFLVIGVGQVVIYHTIRQSSKALQKDSRKQEVAIARRLFLIVFTDFCCWFPIGLMGLLAANGIRISDIVNVWAAIFVLPLNSALNPFLYTLNMFFERRTKRVEKKRMEKIMANLHLEMRAWSSDKALDHMRKCISLGLVTKKDVLGLAGYCPESSQLGKEDMLKLLNSYLTTRSVTKEEALELIQQSLTSVTKDKRNMQYQEEMIQDPYDAPHSLAFDAFSIELESRSESPETKITNYSP